MSYQFLIFQEGEILTALELNQILDNIKAHIHGLGGVTNRVGSLTVRPSTDPLETDPVLTLQKADGSTSSEFQAGGSLKGAQLELTAITNALAVNSQTLVPNLNTQFWSSKTFDNLFFKAPALLEDPFAWELSDEYFYYNGTGGSTTSTTLELQFTTTFLLDDLTKQVPFFRYQLKTSDATNYAYSSIIISKEDGTQIHSKSALTYSINFETIQIGFPSLLEINPDVPVSLGETLRIEFFISVDEPGATAYWDEFYGFFCKPFLTGRL